jgi:hypothetical protein
VQWDLRANPPARGAAGAPQGAGGGGGFGRGRGNQGPIQPAGSYLLKLVVDGKTVGTKTVVIEEDTLQQ